MIDRSRMTAAELKASLARDTEFQHEKQQRDAEILEQAQRHRMAEQPIVTDLRSVGVEVDSVWDLVNSSAPYPAALPVLMEHLELGGYPYRVAEGLARAIAVKPAVKYWERLRTLYEAQGSDRAREGLGVALAASATRHQLDDLVRLLTDAKYGESRILFVRPVLEVGGNRGRQTLEGLRGDPVVGKEIKLALSGRTAKR